MKPWLIYGLLASFAFGLSAIPLKYASSSKYLSGPLGVIVAGSTIGALAVLFPYLLFRGQLNIGEFSLHPQVILLSIISGAVGAVGSVSIILALNDSSTDISRLMAVVSTSALVTAISAMMIFKEIPIGAERIKVLAGVILIIVGIVLVGKS